MTVRGRGCTTSAEADEGIWLCWIGDIGERRGFSMELGILEG